MGRTYRRRRLRIKAPGTLENTTDCVQLKQWLARHGWKNETQLQLRDFMYTGRGVCSRKSINVNDILISVPYQLMVTYKTIQTDLLSHMPPLCEPLKIQELLAIFLMIEVKNKKSFWKEYIESLPQDLPALPWLTTESEMSFYPNDIQKISKQCYENYKDGLERVKKSLPDWGFDDESFKWAYVLVNTRAVYVDPNELKIEGDYSKALLDEPNMALCPFLDMFNHDFNANTEAFLDYQDRQLVYQLRTLSEYKKYDQIFISYGPHNNCKLLMEYGFFIPGNVYDVVDFNMGMVMEVLGVQIDQRQYKFIKEHSLDEKLYIGYDTLSFNLKGFIFVCLSNNCKNFSEVIFGDRYPQGFSLRLKSIADELLDYKIILYKEDCEKFRSFEGSDTTNNRCTSIIMNFLEHRVKFILDLKKMFAGEAV
ncbi:unnamed protein product [Callosobruchus maculatus]|uniref:SET domain-containing protein n=1 Tax=Callosobruchus maculatus TaxID=64391 RepID=A0A653CEV1_CALMS|nr:unnamed protein product [Callosobruchus maculatus]